MQAAISQVRSLQMSDNYTSRIECGGAFNIATVGDKCREIALGLDNFRHSTLISKMNGAMLISKFVDTRKSTTRRRDVV